MSSIPATSSPWLNSGTSFGYQSINPRVPDQRIDDSVEEDIEVVIPIPIDEPTPSSFSVQRLGQPQWEIRSGERWRSITVEEYRGIRAELLGNRAASLRRLADDIECQSRYMKAGYRASHLGALATLVTMKIIGHIDGHPGYLGGLIVDASLSYLILHGLRTTLDVRADILKQHANALFVLAQEDSEFSHAEGVVVISPLGIVNSQLKLTQSTLRGVIEQFKEIGESCKPLNIILNFTVLAMLAMMESKGYFDEHPAYLWILFVDTLLSFALWGKVGSKFNEYADSMTKIADELLVLRKT